MKEKCNKQQKRNKKKQKGKRGREAIVKGCELNDFGGAFRLGFLQLICKVSLIFKSNLELAWSFILKQRELYGSNHVSEDCRCLKTWELLSFLICSLILVFKWRQFLPMYLELQQAQVNYILGKIPNHYELDLYMQNHF